MEPSKAFDGFVSYSREDQDIVQRIVAALGERDKEIWVDWTGIPPASEWERKIGAAIDSARAFIMMLSPASLESAACARELERALESGKRLLPVVCRGIEGQNVPGKVSKWNYIFLKEEDDFNRGIEALMEALEVDHVHVDFHSNLGKEAQLWKEKGEDRSFLLRGGKLEEVHNWALAVGDSEPKLSDLQRHFIEASLTESELEKERAIQSRKEALEMVSRVVGDLRESLEPVGQLGILEKTDAAVAEYFEGRPEEEMLNEELHVKGRALLRRGEVLLEKRRNEEARKLFEEALRIARELCEEDPSQGDWRYFLAEGCLDKGDVENAEGESDEAKRAYRATLTEAKILVEREPDNRDWLQLLSAAYNRLGNVLSDDGRFEEAEELLGKSLDVCYQLRTAHPRDLKYAREVAAEKQALGNVFLLQENYEEARENFEESLEVLLGLITTEPTNALWLVDVSTAHKFLGIYFLRTGQFHTGRRAFQQSLEIIGELIKRDDSNTEWKVILADRYHALGDTLSEPIGDVFSIGAKSDHIGNTYLDLNAALKAYRNRLEIFEALPEDKNQRLEMAESHRLIGAVFQKMGQPEKARQSYQRGLEVIERSLRKKEEDQRLYFAALVCYANLGHVAFTEEGAGHALPWFRQSIDYAEKLRVIDPGRTQWAVELAVCHQNLGTVFDQLNEIAGAREEFAAALQIMTEILGKEPEKINWLGQMSLIRGLAGSLEIRANEPASAKNHFDKAVAIYDDFIVKEPGKLEWRRLATSAYDRVGTVYRQHGLIGEAGEFLGKAVQILEDAWSIWPDDLRIAPDLSSAYQKLADARILENRIEDSEAAIERSIKILKDVRQKDPDNERWKYYLGVAYVRSADIVRRTDSARAGRHFEEAREILTSLARGKHRDTYLHDALRALQQFSDHLAAEGEIGKARDLIEESAELLGEEGIPGRDTAQKMFRHLIATNYVRLGDFLKAESKWEEARELYNRGLEELEQLADSEGPHQLNWDLDLIGTRLRLGDTYLQEGYFDDAGTAYEAALGLIPALLEQNITDFRLRELEATLVGRRARIEELGEDPEKAIIGFEKAINLFRGMVGDVGNGQRVDWEARIVELTNRVTSLRD